MTPPPVCLLHVHAPSFPGAALCLRSGRAPMETPNCVRVVHTRKPQIFLGPVMSCHVWVPVKTRLGGSGGLAQGRLDRFVSCVGARAHVAMPKMLSRDRPCAFCTFVWPVFLRIPQHLSKEGMTTLKKEEKDKGPLKPTKALEIVREDNRFNSTNMS